MLKGTTSSGFGYEIDPSVGNDYRVLDAISDAQYGTDSEKVMASVRLTNLVLGKEGKRRLFNHLAEEGGRVPTEKVVHEITEIFKAIAANNKEIKN